LNDSVVWEDSKQTEDKTSSDGLDFAYCHGTIEWDYPFRFFTKLAREGLLSNHFYRCIGWRWSPEFSISKRSVKMRLPELRCSSSDVGLVERVPEIDLSQTGAQFLEVVPSCVGNILSLSGTPPPPPPPPIRRNARDESPTYSEKRGPRIDNHPRIPKARAARAALRGNGVSGL